MFTSHLFLILPLQLLPESPRYNLPNFVFICVSNALSPVSAAQRSWQLDSSHCSNCHGSLLKKINSSFQRFSATDGSSAQGGPHEPLPFTSWSTVWVDGALATTAAVSWWARWPCHSQKMSCHSNLPSLWLLQTSCVLQCREWHSVPLRTEHSLSLPLCTLYNYHAPFKEVSWMRVRVAYG